MWCSSFSSFLSVERTQRNLTQSWRKLRMILFLLYSATYAYSLQTLGLWNFKHLAAERASKIQENSESIPEAKSCDAHSYLIHSSDSTPVSCHSRLSTASSSETDETRRDSRHASSLVPQGGGSLVSDEQSSNNSGSIQVCLLPRVQILSRPEQVYSIK